MEKDFRNGIEDDLNHGACFSLQVTDDSERA
jgi:hypothetical protein